MKAGKRLRPGMSDRLVNVEEAAEMLCMKKTTVYQWAQARKIPSIKLGSRSIRFKEKDIQKLIQTGYRPAIT